MAGPHLTNCGPEPCNTLGSSITITSDNITLQGVRRRLLSPCTDDTTSTGRSTKHPRLLPEHPRPSSPYTPLSQMGLEPMATPLPHVVGSEGDSGGSSTESLSTDVNERRTHRTKQCRRRKRDDILIRRATEVGNVQYMFVDMRHRRREQTRPSEVRYVP